LLSQGLRLVLLVLSLLRLLRLLLQSWLQLVMAPMMIPSCCSVCKHQRGRH
jgi:hypothetical protein